MRILHRPSKRFSLLKAGLRILLLIVLLAGPGRSAVLGEAGGEVEVKLKLAFLVRFANFVVWPGSGPGPLRYCALGKDDLVEEFDSLDQVVTAGRKIEVLRLADASQAGECQVVYVGALGAGQLKDALGKLTAFKVLSVGSQPEFLEAGGMINLLRDGKKMTFEVNLVEVQRSGLSLSAKLLRLAVRVLQ